MTHTSQLLFNKDPIHHWLHENLTTECTLFINIPWSTIFAYSCWTLWKNRNCRQIKGDTIDSPSLHSILSLATEFLNITNLFNQKIRQTKIIYIKWHPPNQPFILVNIDGSFNPLDQSGGAGGVFREHKGDWLIGFTTNFYCSSSNHAKTYVLKYALEIAKLGNF